MQHVEFLVWLLGTELLSILGQWVDHKRGTDSTATRYQVALSVTGAFRLVIAYLLW